MSLSNRTNQGGSITSYLIIGFFLVVGLVTSVYLFNYRVEQVGIEEKVAQDEVEKQKTTKPEPENISATKSAENDKNTQDSSPIGPSEPNVLPETGIKNNLFEIIALYLMTYFLVSYIISRKKLNSTTLT